MSHKSVAFLTIMLYLCAMEIKTTFQGDDFKRLADAIRDGMLEAMQIQAKNDNARYLTAADACREFGVSRSTLCRWVKAGIVVPFKIGKRWRYTRKSICEAWEHQRTVVNPPKRKRIREKINDIYRDTNEKGITY